MPEPSPPPSRSRQIGIACLAVAILGWGLNWPAIKLLLREWPPLFARGTAGTLGALVLAIVALAARESLAVPRKAIPRLLWGGFTNVFAWMGFSTVAMVWLDVAEGALLVYTMPIWTMLLAWPVQGTRPGARDVAGLVLAFAGVALVLTGDGLSVGPGKLPGIALMLAAAILFALGTVTARRPLPLPPIAATAWQVGIGCVPMIPLGLMLERPAFAAIGPVGWATWFYMAVGPMGVAYLGWFAALRHLPPGTATSGTLLTPIVGVVSAALILGEPFGLRQAAAVALTLGGVALALRPPRPTALDPPERRR